MSSWIAQITTTVQGYGWYCVGVAAVGYYLVQSGYGSYSYIVLYLFSILYTNLELDDSWCVCSGWIMLFGK